MPKRLFRGVTEPKPAPQHPPAPHPASWGLLWGEEWDTRPTRGDTATRGTSPMLAQDRGYGRCWHPQRGPGGAVNVSGSAGEPRVLGRVCSAGHRTSRGWRSGVCDDTPRVSKLTASLQLSGGNLYRLNSAKKKPRQGSGRGV